MDEQAPSPEAMKIVVVDQSHDAFDAARDRADERLDQELGEGGRFRRFAQGIWKGNIAKEYYRQKYTRQEVAEQQEAQDIFVNSPDATRADALESTIQRFQLDAEEVIHGDAGESREVHDESSDIANGLKDIVRQYCEGVLDDSSLHEERTRFLQEYRQAHGDESIGRGIVTTDNILSIAQAVKGSVEHGESLDAAIGKIEVITGEARNGVRTEARYNAVDKIIDTVSKSKFGSLVGPEVIVGSVTLAASIAKWGSHSVVGAVTRTILPGVAAGAWAGLRENKRFKDERSQHMRESAKGYEFEDDAKRRSELESTRYETQTAQALTDHLYDVSSDEFYDEGGEAALRAALEAIAAIETRVKLSDSKNIDLITYENATSIGDERMQLDLARAGAKVALQNRMTGAHRELLGFAEDAPIQEVINAHSAVFIESMEAEITQKDQLFNKLKRTRVAKAAAIGALTGIVIGVAGQELIAAADSTRVGLLEQVWGGNDTTIPADQLGETEQHQTILHGLAEGNETVVHSGPSAEYGDHSMVENSELSVSTDHEFIDNNDGTFSLVDPNGVVTAENIPINTDGSMPPESVDLLDSLGMTVIDKSFDQEVVAQVQQEVTASEYVQNHITETTSVTRDLWYANDTPNVYDQNELNLYRGGAAEAPGIVGDGFQYSVAGMRPEGSWQGGESVDWSQAAASGNLFMAISATAETQSRVFMVPIGADGSVDIKAGDPAWNFFANENGSVAFNGAYAEIVQTAGVDSDGTVHIRPLSTLVGDRTAESIVDTITTTTIEHHANYEITTAGYDTTQTNFTEVAPVLPVESRRGLETQRIRRPLDSYYYSSGSSERERQAILSELSPHLRDNPEAHLNAGEELQWFRDEVLSREGEEYIKTLETFIDRDPGMQRISGATESIVTIPVGAAFESENIYGTLSLYAQQDPEGRDKSAVLLNVNWLDTAIDDPDKLTLIQKTLSEIERAKRDFPDLIIVSMTKEYSQQRAEETGGVIGYVMEDLVNAALLTAQQKIATGVMESDHELLLVRGDADAKGLSSTSLRNFHRALNNDSDLDVLKGVIRYGVEEAKRFPGYGIVSSFMTGFQILATQDNVIHTGGINFGVRMSTLAAVGGLGKMMVENEAGEMVRSTGAGSDDVAIGQRIALARRVDRNGARQYGAAYSSRSGNAESTGPIKRVKLVSGAAMDTSADRLLPMYLSGDSPHNVWNPELPAGYSAGPGGYRDRSLDTAIMDSAKKEDFSKRDVYAGIEKALSIELSWTSEESSRKALAIFFASVPGAYRVTGRFGHKGVRFRFTEKGREFIKNRVERETDGRFGSYGTRKMRQLYGVVPPGTKRQPAGERPPLVSPLV